MKNFKNYFQENYDVYLDMPHSKKYKATIKMISQDGAEKNFSIGTDDNIREAAHKTVKGLISKGYKLKDVEYHF
jgi:hypothetical protein